MLDAAYDRAMDDLDAADDERKDAADAWRCQGPATHPDVGPPPNM
jgi:hypothetical protein